MVGALGLQGVSVRFLHFFSFLKNYNNMEAFKVIFAFPGAACAGCCYRSVCADAAWKLSVQPLGSEPGAVLVVGSPWGPALLSESSSVCPAPQPGKASGWSRGTDIVHRGGDAIGLVFWEKELVECLHRAVPSLMASVLLPTPCPSRRT